MAGLSRYGGVVGKWRGGSMSWVGRMGGKQDGGRRRSGFLDRC
jgi:hypothetical protein